MLGIEKRYVERTARTKSTSFVSQLIIGNFAGALFFLFGAFVIWINSKSPTDIFGAILFFYWLPGRPAFFLFRMARRQTAEGAKHSLMAHSP
jgi:hypothetical protein